MIVVEAGLWGTLATAVLLCLVWMAVECFGDSTDESIDCKRVHHTPGVHTKRTWFIVRFMLILPSLL